MACVFAETTGCVQGHSLIAWTWEVNESIFPGLQGGFPHVELLFPFSGICFLLFERCCSGLDGTRFDLDRIFSNLVSIVSNLDSIVCILDSTVSNLE